MIAGEIMRMSRAEWDAACAKMGRAPGYYPAGVAYIEDRYVYVSDADPTDPTGQPPIDWLALNREFS